MNTATDRTFCVYEKIFKKSIKNLLGVQRCAEGIFTACGLSGALQLLGSGAHVNIAHNLSYVLPA